MKPEQLCSAIVRALRANHPVFLWGSPGTGKTSITFDIIGPQLGLPVWDFRTNSKEPVDLRGLPHLSDGDNKKKLTSWASPDDLPTHPVLIFLDEFNTMLPSMHAPCYQIVQEKRLGNWQAHPDTRIIAAGNRSEDRTVAHKMPTALLTRMIHYDIEVDVDQWCAWGAKSGKIDPIMIGFIRWMENTKGGALHQFDPNARTSPIPRTVEMANNVLRQNPPESSMHTELSGCCGPGWATSFEAYYRTWRELPDIDDILKDPGGYKVSRDLSVRFAIAANLSARMTRENMEACMIYLSKMGEEFCIFCLRDALARDPTLADLNKTFAVWAAEHSQLLA